MLFNITQVYLQACFEISYKGVGLGHVMSVYTYTDLTMKTKTYAL